MQYKVFRCTKDFSEIVLVGIFTSKTLAHEKADWLALQGYGYSIVLLRKQSKGA